MLCPLGQQIALTGTLATPMQLPSCGSRVSLGDMLV